MKYTTKKLAENKVEIDFTLSKEEWDLAIDEAYKKNKNKFNVQGFSKGKAPRKIIEKFYGENVFYEDALDGCFYKYYFEILNKEKDITPIDAPSLQIKEISEKGLSLVATVQNKPPVVLGEYKGLTIKRDVEKIDDKIINEELSKMQQSRARFIEISDREVKTGDIVTIDFVGSVSGVKFEGGSAENHDLEIGSHSFIDNFEDQLIGMKVGDKKDVNVTFPENYPAPNLKAKPAVFAVTLKAIKEKVLPELSDEFASEASEFETLKDLKEDIKKKLQSEAEHNADHKQENDLIEAIVKNCKVDVPDVLIDQQTEDYIKDFEYRLMYQGLKLEDYLSAANTTIEDLKLSRRDDAKKTVKMRLVLEEIIKQEKLKVTDSDIEKKYNENKKDDTKKTIEEIKKELGSEQLSYMENQLLLNKLLKMLKKNNTL